jgi:hypothetical protein
VHISFKINPDIFLYGSKQDLNKMFKMDAEIGTNNEGFFYEWVMARLDVHCPMNFEMYPRDHHTCRFQIGSKNMDVGSF